MPGRRITAIYSEEEYQMYKMLGGYDFYFYSERGYLHRTDGFAIEISGQGSSYYLNGVRHTPEEYNLAIKNLP